MPTTLRAGVQVARLPDDHDDMIRLRELFALAQLRLGEQQNCARHGGGEACIAGSPRHIFAAAISFNNVCA